MDIILNLFYKVREWVFVKKYFLVIKFFIFLVLYEFCWIVLNYIDLIVYNEFKN